MLNLQPPHGKNIVVFDCEIKNPIAGAITWDRHDLMGISVAVAYHYLTGEFRVFMDDNLDDLGALLNGADLISGFNIMGFDNRLLAQTLGTLGKIDKIECKDFQKMLDDKSYDLLVESRKASGWNPSKPFPKSMKLDDHLVSTFGKSLMKTAHGADAPGMFQRGEIGRLTTYCIDDVKRECLLFEQAYAGRPVSTPLHAARMLDRSRFSTALPPPEPPPADPKQDVGFFGDQY